MDQYTLTEGISVGANYALADTEFTDGCDEFQWILTSGGGNAARAICTGNDVNGQGNGSIKGNAFPLSSKNQVSAFVDFRLPIRQLGVLRQRGYSWEDKKPVQVHNLACVPDATIVNSQLGIDTGPTVGDVLRP